MENITLVKATIKELTIIRDIGIKTFVETFAAFNREEDIALYLAASFNLVQLSREIINPNSYFYLLYFQEAVAGYLKLNINKDQSEQLHPTGLEVERIYILKSYQGKQLGKVLLNKAIEVAIDLNKDYIWLGVWEKNEKAIAFYERNKFVRFGKHAFKLGADEQMDYLYKLIMPSNC